MSFIREVLTLGFLIVSFTLSAQNYWQEVESNQPISINTNKLSSSAVSSRIQLDLDAFIESLSNAPLRFSEESKTHSVIIDFPNPKGLLQKYNVVEAPTLSPALSIKYPEIKSYAGYNTNNPSEYVRFDISPRGLHAMILSPTGNTIIINPVNNLSTEVYTVFYKKDVLGNEEFTCHTESDASFKKHKEEPITQKNLLSTEFKTYRLALACTGEYGIYHGNDTTLVLAAMNTTMTRVNGIYEREFALTMQIIDNNDQLIYLEPNEDPYTNSSGFQMLSQNQANVDATIGSSNYDIGHVFSTGGGGVAFLASTCTENKARGVTGGGNPIGDPFDIDYVAHEMGHQFGANHTQNNPCNRVNSAAFEPGSASTIMGYAGICNPNVQNNSDDHFHIHSIYEINAHINGNGNCADIEIIQNTAPTIAPLQDYKIPHSTPFILSADASSNENDSLTYCWEQYDNEIAIMPPEPTNTEGPAFRSNSPSNDNKRYLPTLENVINNTENTWEVLASVEREYTFKVTVRDNHPLAGQLSDAEMNVNVIGSSGPFLVEQPNTNVDWPANSFQTIEWDVANTDIAPINSSHVDIYLSLDGGYTYPITIAENVPNHGYHYGQIPNNQTSTARIMVKGHDNIFYDISDTDFIISQPQEGYSIWLEFPDQIGCEGETFSYSFTTVGFDGFSGPINFQLTDQSEQLIHNFESNPLTPGLDNQLFVSAPENLNNTVTNWDAIISTESDPFNLNLDISATIYPQNVDNVNLVFPADQSNEISPQLTFIWSEVDNATAYLLELALDPGFQNIVQSISDLSNNEYTTLDQLENETTYYWRVTPTNPCSTGNISEIFSFETNSISCLSISPDDLPIPISASDELSINSSLNFLGSGEIIDVNVHSIECEHTWINDLQIELTSPEGTTVQLLDQTCDNENDLFINFDDEAENEYETWPCPPVQGLTYTPSEPLSSFNGENANGEWILTVIDNYPQDGGSLINWDLEICYLGNEPIVVNTIIIEPKCYDSSDGYIFISPENSDNEYTYLWENGDTTNTLYGLSEGTYQVTISNGSEILEQTIQLDAPDPISVQEVITPDLNNQGNGSIELATILGGTTPYSIVWNNGDTGSSIYNLSPGLYSVTITDSEYCEENFEFEVSNLTSPVALFEADTLSGCAPIEIQFTNLSSGDYDEIYWYFEGGSPEYSSLSNPIVSYENAGTYTARLILENDVSSDTLSYDNYITISDIPTADFEFINTSNGIFQFENYSTNATSYFWDFGNGETSTEESPTVTLEYPGFYEVLLIASSICGEDSLSAELLTTSTNNFDSNKINFELSPNPSDGNFSLSWESNKGFELLQWQFINPLGQSIHTEQIQAPSDKGTHHFDQSYLPSGVYFLKIRADSEIKVFRIILE